MGDVENPRFPGGTVELMKYLKDSIKYPLEARKQGIQGRVICRFVVEPDGEITNVEVGKGIDSLLDAEAVRVVKAMPRWIPGKVNGKLVRTNMTLPVHFRLDGKQIRLVDDSEVQEQKITVNQESDDENEVMPSFPGGKDALIAYIQDNLQYPEEALNNGIYGRVVCTFCIEEDGSVTNVEIEKSVAPSLDAEAKRVVLTFPKWNPGSIGGRPVRTKMSIPVTFREPRKRN